MKERVISDAHLSKLADRSARSFCANHHPWGMDVDDVRSRIWERCEAAAAEIVCHPADSLAREAAAKAVIAGALNACRDESKANRSRMQPYQVRKAYERGEDIDRAMNRLGNDMQAWYRRGSLEAYRRRLLETAFRHMRADDVGICRAYMKLGSWELVAAKFGCSEGDFRRKVLPGLKERAQAVWRKVW